MNSSSLRMGLIGCGGISQIAHLPALKKADNVELVAVSDVARDLAEMAARRYYVPEVYGDFREMLEKSEIDAVLVATHHAFHAEISIECMRAGKHVLCEKPLAMSVEECERIVEASEETGKQLQLACMKRYDPGVLKAKEAFHSFAENDEITYARSHLFGGEWICGSPAEERIETDEPYPEIQVKLPEFLPKAYENLMDNLLEQIHEKISR